MPIEIREICIRARVEGPATEKPPTNETHSLTRIRSLVRGAMDAEAASQRRRSEAERRRAKFDR